MTSADLTREQAEALLARLRPQLRYVGRLRDRMNALGFPPGDPLCLAATAAFNGLHAMSVELHYLACSPGTVARAMRADDSR